MCLAAVLLTAGMLDAEQAVIDTWADYYDAAEDYVIYRQAGMDPDPSAMDSLRKVAIAAEEWQRICYNTWQVEQATGTIRIELPIRVDERIER